MEYIWYSLLVAPIMDNDKSVSLDTEQCVILSLFKSKVESLHLSSSSVCSSDTCNYATYYKLGFLSNLTLSWNQFAVGPFV